MIDFELVGFQEPDPRWNQDSDRRESIDESKPYFRTKHWMWLSFLRLNYVVHSNANHAEIIDLSHALSEQAVGLAYTR